jgi:pimeloyl-ACP methyl ester carboxylesterase
MHMSEKSAETKAFETVRSPDGTEIAVETIGTGPALLLVDGAFCGRTFGPSRELAKELENEFAVSFYDRRGRGDSGDTAPYSVEREIEDLGAVLAHLGGRPFVYGISSGAALALEGASSGLPMERLATYEAPYTGISVVKGTTVNHRARLESLLQRNERGAMVSYFLVRMVGAPWFVPLMLRLMPKIWKQQKAVAHTLPYEAQVLNDFELPTDRISRIDLPVLVMVGGKAAAPMADAQARIAATIPGARLEVLEGQTHQVTAHAIASAVRGFFRTSPAVSAG